MSRAALAAADSAARRSCLAARAVQLLGRHQLLARQLPRAAPGRRGALLRRPAPCGRSASAALAPPAGSGRGRCGPARCRCPRGRPRGSARRSPRPRTSAVTWTSSSASSEPDGLDLVDDVLRRRTGATRTVSGAGGRRGRRARPGCRCRRRGASGDEQEPAGERARSSDQEGTSRAPARRRGDCRYCLLRSAARCQHAAAARLNDVTLARRAPNGALESEVPPCTIRASPRPSKAGPPAPDVPRALGGLARAARAGAARARGRGGGRAGRHEPRRRRARPRSRTLLGHKGDLMLIHFRPGFEDAAGGAAPVVAAARLARTWSRATSYVSVVELGMYEMTAQIHARLARARASSRARRSSRRPSTPRWRSSGARVLPRLFLEVPAAPLRLLLPDEQAAGRAQELVRGALRGARAHDARPRRDRPPLRGRGHPDHLRLDRLRRLGVGRRPVRRRPASSSRSSSTRCASTRRARGTASSARSTSGLQFSAAELPRYLEGEVPDLLKVEARREGLG